MFSKFDIRSFFLFLFFSVENEKPECATTFWSGWDNCSVQCGRGKEYRTRQFKNPTAAQRAKCENDLRQERECNRSPCDSFNENEASAIETENLHVAQKPDAAECELSKWGNWSSCSKPCGTGIQIRTRHYLNPHAKKKCQVTD